jgi:hypothetical protein
MTEIIKPIGQTLKKIWTWFNGKKTDIGAYTLAILQIALLLKAPIPVNIVAVIEIVATTFFLGGAGHKALKSKAMNKAAENVFGMKK